MKWKTWIPDVITIRTVACAFVFFGFLSGCSLLQRSPDSGYRDGQGLSDLNAYRQDRETYELQRARGEMGLNRQSLSGDQQEALETRVDLLQAEKTLVGSREREQYYSYKPLMRNDRERMEFIEVGSYEGRQRWLQNRGYLGNETRVDPQYQPLVQTNDISLGMPKHVVREAWGEPDAIDVAGNPIYQNERWKYLHQEPSQDGYLTSNRIVYFESGRVVGWETH